MKKSHAIVVIFLVAIVVGLILMNGSTILSFFQKPIEAENSSNENYTELTLREGDTIPIEFGDTEYSLYYAMGHVAVYAPFQSDDFIPSEGKTFKTFGVEIKVSEIDSDYISKYVVLLIRPTVEKYMFSTFRYTKVEIPVYDSKTVNISSGLINKTNQYTFGYGGFDSSVLSHALVNVRNATKNETYYTQTNFLIPEAEKDFDIEIRVYKADSESIILYVKPLY